MKTIPMPFKYIQRGKENVGEITANIQAVSLKTYCKDANPLPFKGWEPAAKLRHGTDPVFWK